MRVVVVGGGLAGVLLAWRLTGQLDAGDRVDLLLGPYRDRDATAWSGGSVRAYETDPDQRDLATASLVELLGSPVLRRWTDYRECGSTYVRAGAPGLDQELAGIDHELPGSVERIDAAELERRGWAGVETDVGAIVERRAGYTDPRRLREHVLADLATRSGADLLDASLVSLDIDRAGPVACATMLGTREYDAVVLATGAWTPTLLGRLGLPVDGYRTKVIQHVVCTAAGGPATPFVDGPRDLYGRPTADGRFLLGVPTRRWDVDPDRAVPDPVDDETARARAVARFPALRLGPTVSRVVATDCYAAGDGLALRPLAGDRRLATFTGGSGGSAKTVLAASARAAPQLAQIDRPAEPTPAG